MLRTLTNFRPGHLFLLVVVGWLAGLPLAAVLYGAFVGADGEWTAERVTAALTTTKYLTPLIATLEIGFYVGLISTAVGGGVAWIMSRLRPFGSGFLEVGIMVPIFMSPFIGAVGWMTMARPGSGLLNLLFGSLGIGQVNIVSYWGAVFIMALYFVPYAYSLQRHAMDRMNPELEEAGRICGAPPHTVILQIVAPIIWPSIISSLLITFILAAEMFVIPSLMLVPRGYTHLSYLIYDRTTHWPIDRAEASAIGVILLIITVLGMLLYTRSIRMQERFITVGARASRTSMVPLAQRLAGTGAVLFFILLTCVLPILAILLRSVDPYFNGTIDFARMNFGGISRAFSDQNAINAIRNSMMVTVGATAALLATAFMVALYRVKSPNPVTTATWVLASIPIAVPGVLIGLGMIWVYIGTPIYATIWIIFLVMMARFLPIAVRMFETGLLQLGRELDEAARISGATEFQIIRSIRLPLLARTIKSAVTITGTQVFNEVSSTTLLYTYSSSMLPVVIFSYMVEGDYARGTVLALVQVSILTAVIGLGAIIAASYRLARRRFMGMA